MPDFESSERHVPRAESVEVIENGFRCVVRVNNLKYTIATNARNLNPTLVAIQGTTNMPNTIPEDVLQVAVRSIQPFVDEEFYKQAEEHEAQMLENVPKNDQ